MYAAWGKPGSLDNIDGTRGRWNLSMSLIADWNQAIWALGEIKFTSAASHDYFGSSGLATITGDMLQVSPFWLARQQ